MNGYPRFGWVDILRFQQFLRTLLRTVTRFLFFSLGKKKVGGNTIIHTIRINLPSHFGYAILIIIDILQQKLKDFSLPYDKEKS